MRRATHDDHDVIAPPLHAWLRVSPSGEDRGMELWRARVVGGWLYQSAHNADPMVYVPDLDAGKGCQQRSCDGWALNIADAAREGEA